MTEMCGTQQEVRRKSLPYEYATAYITKAIYNSFSDFAIAMYNLDEQYISHLVAIELRGMKSVSPNEQLRTYYRIRNSIKRDRFPHGIE